MHRVVEGRSEEHQQQRDDEDAGGHGGQVRIGSQGLWSTSQGFLPKYTSGVNQMGESQVVISRGLGDSEPFPRIFNQPELVVVDVN